MQDLWEEECPFFIKSMALLRFLPVKRVFFKKIKENIIFSISIFALYKKKIIFASHI